MKYLCHLIPLTAWSPVVLASALAKRQVPAICL